MAWSANVLNFHPAKDSVYILESTRPLVAVVTKYALLLSVDLVW